MVRAPMATTKMTREMHEAMQKLIDAVRPRDLDTWLDDVMVIDAEEDMPWMIESPTHSVTKIDGKFEIIDRKMVH